MIEIVTLFPTKHAALNENFKNEVKKMADINISKEHNLNIDTAKERLEKVAADLKKDYGISSTWSGNTCELSGTGLKKGNVYLDDKKVTIEIALGMLAKAMKGKIEKQINSEFDKVLG